MIDLETHEAVFTWMLQRLADAGLVKGKTVGIDATTSVSCDSCALRPRYHTWMMFVSAMTIVVALVGTLMQAPAAAEHHRAGAAFFKQARLIETPSRARHDAIAKGIAAEDRALAIEPDFLDALLYKYLSSSYGKSRFGTELPGVRKRASRFMIEWRSCGP